MHKSNCKNKVTVYEEGLFVLDNSVIVSQENCDAIRYALFQNEAVGAVAGYYDKELSIVFASDIFLQNLGYSHEEFLNVTDSSLLKIIYDKDRNMFEVNRFKKSTGMSEFKMLAKDGSPVNVRSFKTESKDKHGRAMWIISVRINKEGQQLNLVNDIIQSGFWSIDYDEYGNVSNVMWSNKIRQMLGYNDTNDLPNTLQAWKDSIYPEDKKYVIPIFNSIPHNLSRNNYDFEYRLKLKNGTYQWFRINAEVTRRINGTINQMVGVCINIDKRKQEEETSHRMYHDNEMLEQLVNGMVRIVSRFSICDIMNNKFEYYSLENSEVYNPSGIYDDLYNDICSTHKMLLEEQDIWQVLSIDNIKNQLKTQEDVYKFECCSIDEKVFKNVAIIPIEWQNGTLSKFLMVAQNITSEKKIEFKAKKALKEACEAANQANTAKTQFLSNMSHDIRTPMNAIIGMTAIAGTHIDDSEKVKDCLAKITKSSRHLLGIINEILDMSRIESGRITLTEEEFSLSDLIDNLLDMIMPGIEEKEHNLNVRILNIKHEDVIGDSLRIQQVFMNIMSNAIKYTNRRGKITITIQEKSTNKSKIGCYEFIVEDNGIGMSEDFQKEIFKPFTRENNEQTAQIQGTGLGMAITSNIVKMMNGKIAVESEPGKGSRFIVDIFLKLQNKNQVPIEELINLPVLVVDDDKMCCINAVDVLNDIGIDAQWVTSGKQAIDITMQKHNDGEDFFAIILDWKMPEIDGIETARQIRKNIGPNIPIIVLSAYDCSEIEEQAKSIGIDAFISKPLFKSKLTKLFKELVEVENTEQQKNPIEQISKMDYSDKRILVVEDNEINREITIELIKMTGAKVEEADNGKIAVDMIINSRPYYYDMIFMDVQMPFMNGYEATIAIRALNREDTNKIPIIATTANAFAEDVVLSKSSGMNEHIAKPIDIARLKDILSRWL